MINGYKREAYKSVTNQFQDGITFEDIYELYQFDNDLQKYFHKVYFNGGGISSLPYRIILSYTW